MGETEKMAKEKRTDPSVGNENGSGGREWTRTGGVEGIEGK
jgi:hypothetical protein